MPIVRIQLPRQKLIVVLNDVPHQCILQQLVAVVHLHTQTIQRINNLVIIRNNRLAIARQLRQEMSLNLVKQRQFHLLRIHQHKLHIGRMLLV